MNYIFFYSNNYLNNIVEKKYESKILYANYIIRYSLAKNKLVKVLDNSSIVLHFCTKKYNVLESLNLLKEGSTIFGNEHFLTNMIDKNKTFYHFLPILKKNTTILQKLKNFKKYTKYTKIYLKETFTSLIPLKGGWVGLTHGILCFLKNPKKNFFQNQKFII